MIESVAVTNVMVIPRRTNFQERAKAWKIMVVFSLSMKITIMMTHINQPMIAVARTANPISDVSSVKVYGKSRHSVRSSLDACSSLHGEHDKALLSFV